MAAKPLKAPAFGGLHKHRLRVKMRSEQFEKRGGIVVLSDDQLKQLAAEQDAGDRLPSANQLPKAEPPPRRQNVEFHPERAVLRPVFEDLE